MKGDNLTPEMRSKGGKNSVMGCKRGKNGKFQKRKEEEKIDDGNSS